MLLTFYKTKKIPLGIDCTVATSLVEWFLIQMDGKNVNSTGKIPNKTVVPF